MSNIDLMKFCAGDNETRTYLRTPWRVDGKIVATNGHIMICIDDDGRELPESESKVDKRPDVTKHLAAPDGLVWQTVHPTSCSSCNSTGELSDDVCGICDGNGWFYYGDHQYDCKDCDGSGKVVGVCSECRSDGPVVLETKIALRYIRLIAELPGSVIGCIPTETQKAWINFDGGIGVVMGLRR